MWYTCPPKAHTTYIPIYIRKKIMLGVIVSPIPHVPTHTSKILTVKHKPVADGSQFLGATAKLSFH